MSIQPSMKMNSKVRKFALAYLRRRHAILFYSLLLTLIAAPLLAVFSLGDQWLQFFLALNLVAGVVGEGGRGHWRLFLAVVIAIVLARLIAIGVHSSFVSVTLLDLWIVIGLLAAANMLRFALRATTVDAEHVYAALSAYLLAGLFLGVLYWNVERVWPGSIHMPADGAGFTPFHAVYFSFVTLATLGYGDIVPKSDLARGLVIFEAIAGQLYLAVMISRLISLYVRSPAKDKS